MCAQGTHHQTIQLSFNGSQTVRWSTLKLATFESSSEYARDQVKVLVHAPQDLDVQVVSHVGPDNNKEREERRRRGVVPVVDALGELMSVGVCKD